MITWTERVWTALQATYQPTKVEYVMRPGKLTSEATRVPDGVRRVKAYALGPKACFALLAVARVLDSPPYLDAVTSHMVAEVSGLPQSGAAKMLLDLTNSRWLESFIKPDTRSTKYYRIIGA